MRSSLCVCKWDFMAVLDRRLAGTSGGEWLVDFEARTGLPKQPQTTPPPPRGTLSRA